MKKNKIGGNQNRKMKFSSRHLCFAKFHISYKGIVNHIHILKNKPLVFS